MADATATGDGPGPIVAVDAFGGKPPRRIDLSRPAPLGWSITTVASLVSLLETIAVGAVGGALPSIQRGFALSDSLAGVIPTVTVLGGLLVFVTSARLSDRHKRIRVLFWVGLLWSGAVLAQALAPLFIIFLAMRAVLGAAAQLNNPSASTLIADVHPARSRSKAYGYERLANYIGLPLGIAVGGALSEAFDWRVAFGVLAVPGVLIAGSTWLLSEPRRGLGDRLDGLRLRSDDDDHVPVVVPSSGDEPERLPTIGEIRTVAGIPTMRSLLVGVPLLFLGLAGLFYWVTSYFEEVHGLSEKSAAGIGSGAGGTGILIGIIIGGVVGDRYHGSRTGWRLRFGGAAFLSGAIVVGAALVVPGLAVQVVLFVLANVGFAAAIPNLTASVADVVPADNRGMGFAVVQFLIAIGSALGPLLVGVTSDWFVGSLRPAMWALVVPMVIGSILILRGARHVDADSAAVVAGAA